MHIFQLNPFSPQPLPLTQHLSIHQGLITASAGTRQLSSWGVPQGEYIDPVVGRQVQQQLRSARGWRDVMELVERCAAAWGAANMHSIMGMYC